MDDGYVFDKGQTYYVYLLVKQAIGSEAPTAALDLGNVLYVGKGKGYRWRDHFNEALAAMPGPKADAIRAALGQDPSPGTVEQHAIIAAGHLTEAEAFRLEAILLHLVGGVRAVTNLVAGHNAPEMMVPAFDARVFFGAEDLAVDAWKVSGLAKRQQSRLLGASPPGSVVFVVKGTPSSLEEPAWRRTEQPGRFKCSVLMEHAAAPPTNRRGWDPHNPWTPEEAATRARRFWAGSKASVALWQQLIEDRKGYLALVVPDPRDGRSVVRYMWSLEVGGTWEDYGNRFGFPLGAPVQDHPWLGKRLVDENGRGLLSSPSAPALTLWNSTAPLQQSL